MARGSKGVRRLLAWGLPLVASAHLVAVLLAVWPAPAAQAQPAQNTVRAPAPTAPPPDPAHAGTALEPSWPQTLLLLADSVVLDIKSALAKHLPDWKISHAGRPSLMLPGAVETLRKRKEPVPSVVVIGLGYNTLWSRHNRQQWSDQFDADADELLRLLRDKGARKIVWVLVRELTQDMVAKGIISPKMLADYRHYVDVNQRLRALKARHPELALADWATPGRQAGLTMDAVHLNTRGIELMVQVLKPAIGIGLAAPTPPVPPAPPAATAPAPVLPAPAISLTLPPIPPPPPAAELQPVDTERPAPADPAPTASQPKPGEVFRDCAECPELVVLPAGRFTMGSPDSEEGGREEERPQREVTIARALAVGRFEVTFAEWEACVQAGGCRGNATPEDEGWGRGRRPVINVSWEDTREYLHWLSGKTGRRYRLLSEAEWEFAARAGTATPFATGGALGTRQANFNDSENDGAPDEAQKYRAKTLDVGAFLPNAFGLHDMHGNVWEWVEDVWADSYADAPGDGSPRRAGDEDMRVLRGGSWYRVLLYARSASRHSDVTSTRSNEVGFRVARDLE